MMLWIARSWTARSNWLIATNPPNRLDSREDVRIAIGDLATAIFRTRERRGPRRDGRRGNPLAEFTPGHRGRPEPLGPELHHHDQHRAIHEEPEVGEFPQQFWQPDQGQRSDHHTR